MTQKDKKIIEDSEARGIPIFVLTAKDRLSVQAIEDYLLHCGLQKCDVDHRRGIRDRLNEFKSWQKANPGQVKLPD